ncbi:ubiquitin-conjugating enzyme E2 Z, partial [Parus major]|uniref:ubiquitin-conjugating enzyme E2 Z n=1 Tax=Parus major TaxID=9157 RepID=UPI001443B483
DPGSGECGNVRNELCPRLEIKAHFLGGGNNSQKNLGGGREGGRTGGAGGDPVPALPVPSGVMEKSFMEYLDFYEGVCKERLHLQGQTMQDPFGEKRGHFDYQALLGRLQGLRARLQERLQQDSADMDSESSSSEPEPDTQGCPKA